MKAKATVPASTEEQKYDFKFLVDVINSAAYDAKSNDISSLELPDDVAKMVTRQFIELRKIFKKLNQAIKDKQVLEKMRREANTKAERKNLNKDIIELTKALDLMRNDKIDWHSGCTWSCLSCVTEETRRLIARQISLEKESRKKNVRRPEQE